VHPSKVRGKILDRLCDEKVFYVEKGNGGFLVVDGCNSAYFTTVTPIELIELGTELVRAGNKAIRKSVNE
jgi:hypothetical protein